MKNLSRYYVSRTIIAVALGALLALGGIPWWVACLGGGLALAFFLWAPRSGRYTVQAEKGATALRRDEWTQAIAHQAARNAFVVTILALSATVVYFGVIAPGDVPIGLLSLTIALGLATYLATDVWLRRH